MTGTAQRKDSGDRFGKLTEDVLKKIADDIAVALYKSSTSREVIRKYALRQEGADHILSGAGHNVDGESSRPGADHIKSYRKINQTALSQEVLIILFKFIQQEELPVAVADAIRRNDVERLKRLFYNKCLSRFFDGARNPRYRAIREILSEENGAGSLRYYPGRGFFSGKSEERGTLREFGAYSFAGDTQLDYIEPDKMDKETFADWPVMPQLRGAEPQQDASRTNRKELVLAQARFFWQEVAQRYGNYNVRISDLKRYIEKTTPPWMLEAFLPDPVAAADYDISISPSDTEEDSPMRELSSGPIDEATGLRSGVSFDQYETPVEFLPLQDMANRFAAEWFGRLGTDRAIIFCLMFHCGHGPTEAAVRASLNSPQIADYHYKAAKKDLAHFCTLKEGLSEPDLDLETLRLFSETLETYCDRDVLREGC